ncbi:MAG: lysylphosphatidylglycerol synthase transmembrane domain-containing protein, partial [Bdellovibrionota bacterium]
MTKQKVTPYLKLILKLAFVVALFYFLFKKGWISMQETQKAFANWDQIVPAVLAFGFCIILGILRWQILLRAQGIQLSFARTTQLTLIGNFFNLALPGAVSGDFVMAFYIGKEAPGKRARAFSSILFDRLVGISALIVISAGALLFNLSSFEGTRLLGEIEFLVVAAAAVALGFFVYLFLVQEHHDPLLKLFKFFEGRFKSAGSLTRIYEGLRTYHHHRMAVLQVMILSLTVHLIIGWGLMRFSFALGESHLSFSGIYALFPLGMLVTAVPVMPAGIGTGHVAFGYLFKLMSSDRGADVFTLYVLVTIFYSSLGGLAYLRFKTENPDIDLK